MKKRLLSGLLVLGLLVQGTVQTMDKCPRGLQLMHAGLSQVFSSVDDSTTIAWKVAHQKAKKILADLKANESDYIKVLRRRSRPVENIIDAQLLDTRMLGTPIEQVERTYYDHDVEERSIIRYESYDKNSITALQNAREYHEAIDTMIFASLGAGAEKMRENAEYILYNVLDENPLNYVLAGGALFLPLPVGAILAQSKIITHDTAIRLIAMWSVTGITAMVACVCGSLILDDACIGAAGLNNNNKKLLKLERLSDSIVTNVNDHPALQAALQEPLRAQRNNADLIWIVVGETKEPMERENMPPQVENNNGNDCSICCSTMNSIKPTRTLTCKHKFHKNCIEHWFNNNVAGTKQCPYCMKAQ